MPDGPEMSLDWSLYVIIDEEWLRGFSVPECTEMAIAGGATIIQYRNKVSGTEKFMENAEVLRVVTHKHHVPLIINDRLDIALAVEADGVHLGQGDLAPQLARQALGPDMLLGISIDQIGQLIWSEGADYFGVGAVFPTNSKTVDSVGGLALVRKVRERTALPLIGIGGINGDNAASVIEAGCDGVAVISAVLGADHIETAARKLSDVVHRAKQKRNEQ